MSGPEIFPILLALVVVLIIAGAILAWKQERRRREALARAAAALGFTFDPSRNPALARQYESLRGLREGGNRYTFDVLEGRHREQPLTVFDHHHETTSTDGKGNTQTQHHYQHVVILHLGREFPKLLIAPETVFSKIAQAFGYDDIDFESHEFSRRFCVRSPDRRFAYDFCNPAMIEFLLTHPSLALEVQGGVLALVFRGRMKPEEIQIKLDLACDLHERMPAYLFSA